MAMGRATLTCSKCGKEYQISKKCYNREDADKFESWAKTIPDPLCGDCYAEKNRNEKQAKIEAQTIKNTEGAKSCPLILPELKGSEKQIKWASDLRNGVITQMVNKKFYWDKAEETAKTNPAVKIEWDKLFQESAKWWIENRFKKIFEIFEIGA